MRNLVSSIVYCLLLAFCLSCSSDTDDISSQENTVNKYSEAEIQKIKQLQEDYGVEFSIPNSSIEPLASIDEIEELCKMVAIMNTATKHGIRNGNIVRFSVHHRTRSLSKAKESYSGSLKSTGTIDDCAYFDYEITWRTSGEFYDDVQGRVISITCYSGWDLCFNRFSASPDGLYKISYIFYFDAITPQSHRIYNIQYKGSLSI